MYTHKLTYLLTREKFINTYLHISFSVHLCINMNMRMCQTVPLQVNGTSQKCLICKNSGKNYTVCSSCEVKWSNDILKSGRTKT